MTLYARKKNTNILWLVLSGVLVPTRIHRMMILLIGWDEVFLGGIFMACVACMHNAPLCFEARVWVQIYIILGTCARL